MYEFGVDFIARCLAGEALEEVRDNVNHLVAGPNISIQHDAPNHQTIISNTMPVDDELSTTSENPVQNKVITNELKYKPDTYTGSTRTANQKIVQLTREEYDAIDTKDPNTYYMITDDISYVIRTAYVDVTDDVEITVDSNTGSHYISFEAPEDFEMLEARINYEITWSCGSWNNTKSGLTSILTITPADTAPPREGRKIYMGVTEDKWLGTAPNQTHINEEKATLIGANYITYNSATNKIRIEISKPIYNYVNIDPDDLDNTVLTINDFKVNEVGYVAYGSDNINITEDSYRGGNDITITNGVIDFTGQYGYSVEMTIDPDTYVISLKLKDQDGNQLGSTQTVDLPLESVVVSGSYDSGTKTITLTLEDGSVISIPVGDLVSGLQTELSASNKLDPAFIAYDSTHAAVTEADKTAWNAIDGVPAVTSSDNGKVLKATHDGTTGTYSWQNETQFTQVQADWTEADNTAVDYIKNKPNLAAVATSGSYNDLSNKPTIPAAQVNSDWNANSGVAEILNKPNLATVATSGSYADLTNKPTIPAAQVNSDWNASSGVAQILNKPSIPTATSDLTNDSGYLTHSTAAEVPAVTSSDNDKTLVATYSGGIGSYAWQSVNYVPSATAGTDEGKVLTADVLGNPVWRNVPTPTDMATQTWVVNQGYLTSADEVPDVTSSDDGKVLKATYSGGVGSYSWETAPSGGTTDYTDLTNKPAIENHTLAAGNNTAASLGLATTSDISDMATQTWVGQQGYLTSADEVPTVTSNDDGKVLKATYSGGAGSYSWETAPTELPASSSIDEGKVLTVDSSGNPTWLNVDVDEVPAVTSNDDGKVLTATYSGGVGSYAWATAGGGGGGGLSVETDGTNYWITVNGIRLYFASSAPSGTIPDGSMGIGW